MVHLGSPNKNVSLTPKNEALERNLARNELRNREAKRVRGEEDDDFDEEAHLAASPVPNRGIARPVAKKPKGLGPALQQAVAGPSAPRGGAGAGNAPAPPPRAPAVGSQAAFLRNLTKGQLDDMYASCLKLATENKITTNNSWSLQFIDHLSEFVNPAEREEETNFQRASVTLDAGVKIYCYRVDSVHTETHRILRAVTRGGNKPEEEAEEEAEGGEAEGAGDGAQGAKKRQRKLLKADPSATLERPENLNVKKFDLAFAVDPLFKKTSAQFDAGGARGLLLNNLSVYNGCHVMFDSFERPGEAKANQPPAGPEFLTLRGDLAKEVRQLPSAALEGVRLAPGIEEIERLLGPVTPDPRFRATAPDLVKRARDEAMRQAAELPRAPRRTGPPPALNAGGQPLAVAEEAPDADELRVEDGGDQGGMGEEEEEAAVPLPAPVMEEDGAVPEIPHPAEKEAAAAVAPVEEEAYDYEGGGGGDYEYGGGDAGMADSFEDDMGEMAAADHANDEAAEGPAQGMRVPGPAVGGEVDQEEAEAARKRDEAIAWLSGQYKPQKSGWQGGALRARVQPLRRRVEAPQGGVVVEEDEEDREREKNNAARKRRKPRIGALDYEKLGELDDDAFLPPPANGKRSIVLKTVTASGNTLQPKDYNVVIPDLTRLFLRPRGFVTVGSKDANVGQHEALAADIGFELDANQGGEGHGDDDDEGGGGNYEGYDYEGGGDLIDDYGDLAHRAVLGDIADNAMAPLQLVQAPRKVQAIAVNYARISKQVDVRALKEELWEGISTRAPRRPTQGSREAHAAGVPGAEDGAASISFRELLHTVPDDTKAGRIEDLSVHLNFICLLHLANERGLFIRGNPKLDDLTITSIPAEGAATKGAGTPGARRK